MRQRAHAPLRQVEHVLHSPLGEPSLQVGHRLKDEGVVAVARPGVVGPEALVHQQGDPQLVGLIRREVEGEVLLDPHRDPLHPVQHEFPACAGGPLTRGVDAEVVDEGHSRYTPRRGDVP